MRRPLISTVLAGALLLAGFLSPASAQQPLVRGDVPDAGAIGLLSVTTDTPVFDVADELEGRGCLVLTLSITLDGRWHVFIPDAPGFVVAGFPDLAAGQAFVVRCEDGVATQDNVVTGTLTYLQRIALPPSAVVTVSLVDVSLQDAPAPVIAEETFNTDGRQVPFSFALVYDHDDIRANHTYAVQAEIRVNGDLWFTTDASYPVITSGAPRDVDIVLVQVAGTDPGDDPRTQIVGREWTWLAIASEDGSTVEPNTPGDSALFLNPDGSVYISTDCNSFVGSYELDGESLTITPEISTLIACPGESTQDTYVEALEWVTAWTLVSNGRTLVLDFGAGTLSFSSP